MKERSIILGKWTHISMPNTTEGAMWSTAYGNGKRWYRDEYGIIWEFRYLPFMGNNGFREIEFLRISVFSVIDNSEPFRDFKSTELWYEKLCMKIEYFLKVRFRLVIYLFIYLFFLSPFSTHDFQCFFYILCIDHY